MEKLFHIILMQRLWFAQTNGALMDRTAKMINLAAAVAAASGKIPIFSTLIEYGRRGPFNERLR